VGESRRKILFRVNIGRKMTGKVIKIKPKT
jgi:hypothetical protein